MSAPKVVTALGLSPTPPSTMHISPSLRPQEMHLGNKTVKISCIDRRIEQKLLLAEKVGKTVGRLSRRKLKDEVVAAVERPEALLIDEVSLCTITLQWMGLPHLHCTLGSRALFLGSS
uniref:Uncharacterized protein n=1 Tax=Caenorhabditis japonica TaxID=281687 RepID=A0A8R1J006_CAEJA